MFVEISYKVKYKSGQGHCIIWSDGDNDIVSSEANICSCRHSWHVTLRHASWHLSCEAPHHKSAAPEGGEVARNQAPPHRLDWPINAMFILGIRKSKIKQNGYYLFFHFLLLNISHICRLTIIINSLLTFPTNTITIKFCNSWCSTSTFYNEWLLKLQLWNMCHRFLLLKFNFHHRLNFFMK